MKTNLIGLIEVSTQTCDAAQLRTFNFHMTERPFSLFFLPHPTRYSSTRVSLTIFANLTCKAPIIFLYVSKCAIQLLCEALVKISLWCVFLHSERMFYWLVSFCLGYVYWQVLQVPLINGWFAYLLACCLEWVSRWCSRYIDFFSWSVRLDLMRLVPSLSHVYAPQFTNIIKKDSFICSTQMLLIMLLSSLLVPGSFILFLILVAMLILISL